MDTSYIKLCAEMAYNDVIIESVLSEDYNILNEEEGKSSIKDRIKNIFNAFITFLKNLWNKFFSFLTTKIKEFKAKMEEIKKKKEAKSIKQESASLYNQLIEMVLVESKDDMEITNIATIDKRLSIMYDSLSDFIDNAREEVLNHISNVQDKYFEGKQDGFVEKIDNPEYSIYAEFSDNIAIKSFKLRKIWKKPEESIVKCIKDFYNAEYDNGIDKIAWKYAKDYNINIIDKQLSNYSLLKSKFDVCESNCKKAMSEVKVDNPKVGKYISTRLQFLQQIYSGAITAAAANITYIMKIINQYNKDLEKINNYNVYEQNKKFKPSI